MIHEDVVILRTREFICNTTIPFLKSLQPTSTPTHVPLPFFHYVITEPTRSHTYIRFPTTCVEQS